jgi:hypothetical protein
MLDMTPGGSGRLVVSLVVLALLVISAFFTMEPGKYQTLTFVLLAFFGIRVVLGRLRSR